MRRFVDTNVLVYSDDLDAGPKQKKALALVESLFTTGEGVLSTQVLQEFFVIATTRLGVEPVDARRHVELFAMMDLVHIDLDLVLGAIDLHRLHRINFWDALIVKAASRAGCGVLLTEDLQHGQVIDGVRIEDPFATL